MSQAPYELVTTPEGVVARVRARGSAVLTNPFINRGTAFTDEQRRELDLVGLLPRAVKPIDAQLRRTYAQYSQQPSDLAKWVYLTNLRDRNEVLFYRLLSEHIEEMMPIVYTPTVGLAIERFSHEFRRPRGVYLSVDHPEEVETALRNTGLGPDDVDLHARVRDERYDQLIDAYVTVCQKLFPNAMLHWEDFGASNARRILARYADRCCTLNDDVQGTAAVVLAAALAGVRAAGTRLRDLRVVIHGAGTAGLGIADMAVARARRISDGMIAAAADAVAGLSDATATGASLLPPVTDLRRVSATVAVAVALAAVKEGLAQAPIDDPIRQVHQAMWRPDYPHIEAVGL